MHEFLGHHTCSNRNGREYVEQNAPFWADYDPEKGNFQFLGSGYYFWDDNEEMAHHWGKVHYKGEYCILEAELNTPPEQLLDLVGSRKAMKYVKEFAALFEGKANLRGGWDLGGLLEFLKKLNETEEFQGIFPFKIVRAVDSSVQSYEKQSGMKFVETKRSFTYLDPRIIICLIDKKTGLLMSKRLLK